MPAALLLMLPRLAGADRWRLPGVPDDLGALTLSIAGLVMLVMAALPAMSLASGSLRRGRDRLEETLAAWQLRRWWQRHAAAGFLVVFAFATAAFSAVALASQVLAGPASALGQGITASLAIGFASSTMTALLAYGLVFLVNCRSRVDYYAALLVDGLPAAAVRRSIEIEQNSVLLLGLGVGIAIGLILVVATASAGGQSGVALGAVAAGLTATAAIGLAAGCTIAWLVRRHVVGFRLVEHGWRAT